MAAIYNFSIYCCLQVSFWLVFSYKYIYTNIYNGLFSMKQSYILICFISVCYITKHTNTYDKFITFKMAATSAYKQYVSIATYINKRISSMGYFQ